MTFGERIRELRLAKNLTLREVAAQVAINFTYLSKIENAKLDFSEFPSERLIRKLALVLGGEVDPLLLLAQKVPDGIRRRVLERPDAFSQFATLTDPQIDEVLTYINTRSQRARIS